MRAAGAGGRAIAAYAIASDAPKAVEQAHARFSKISRRLHELRDTIHEAEQKIADAKIADVDHVAAEAIAGRMVDDPHEREQAAKRELADVTAHIAGVERAVDQVGDELLVAIDAARGPWAQTVRKRLADAHERYTAAIAAALEAAGDIRSGRAALRWFDEFDTDRDRRHGPLTNYTGSAPLTIEVRMHATGEPQADELLLAAQRLTAEEPKPPEPRRLQAARPDDDALRMPRLGPFIEARHG